MPVWDILNSVLQKMDEDVPEDFEDSFDEIDDDSLAEESFDDSDYVE